MGGVQPCVAQEACAEDGVRAAEPYLDDIVRDFADAGGPLEPPKPLWRIQVEESNELQRRKEQEALERRKEESDELSSLSTDNYSYEDDDDESVLERAQEALRRKEEGMQELLSPRSFDAEWHSLLSRMGNFGGVGDGMLVDEAVLRAEFDAMDVDGNGSLDIAELACVFDKLGIIGKPYKLANLMSLADQDNSGTIEWPEFSKIVKLGLQWQEILKQVGTNVGKKRGPVLERILKKEFEKIDVDGNGTLDEMELRMLFANLEVPMEDDVIAGMIMIADKDGNGMIEWEEFRKMFHVVNTVARLTRPRKSVKAAAKAPAKRDVGNTSIEWQSIIQDVGSQIQKNGVGVDHTSLKKEFKRIDVNGDGCLDHTELGMVFSQMGISLDSDKLRSLVALADDDGNSMIEWPEFKKMFHICMQWHEFLIKLSKGIGNTGKLTDNVLRRQFIEIDVDRSGALDFSELRQVFRNLHIDMDDATLRKLLLLADGDGTGCVEWPEFRRMFQVVRSVGEHNSGLSPHGRAH